jgi:hypothetical protein
MRYLLRSRRAGSDRQRALNLIEKTAKYVVSQRFLSLLWNRDLGVGTHRAFLPAGS